VERGLQILTVGIRRQLDRARERAVTTLAVPRAHPRMTPAGDHQNAMRFEANVDIRRTDAGNVEHEHVRVVAFDDLHRRRERQESKKQSMPPRRELEERLDLPARVHVALPPERVRHGARRVQTVRRQRAKLARNLQARESHYIGGDHEHFGDVMQL